MAEDLIKKLRVPKEQPLLVLNAPEGLLEALGLNADTQAKETYPFVMAFVRSIAELSAMKTSLIASVVYDGLLWITYPKKTAGIVSDLSRDILWRQMEDTGWRPVMLIALDATWSAMRFRPVEKVQAK